MRLIPKILNLFLLNSILINGGLMKKFRFLFVCLLSLVGISPTVHAEDSDKPETVVYLPEPQKNIGVPLMKALNDRKTTREFSVRKISDQDLSNLLWAAVGINRPNGKLTIPTARDARDLSVYIIKQGGAYRYNAEDNTLELVNPAALIYTAAKQGFVKDADALLVYVSNNENQDYRAMHAGSVYQNVGLYAASAGMSNVVLGMIDREMLHKELHLTEKDFVVIGQALGWPKSK